MDLFMDILAFVLKCLTLYTAVTGALFLLPRKKYPEVPPAARFALLIPARNEEAVIGSLIGNLRRQNYPADLYDIYVIPNNCTDNTEAAARNAGARILRCGGAVYTKGDVLHQVFEQLKGSYDAYCVFDADNLAHPDFLARMNDAIASGAQAAKGRQVALNPYDSWITGCYDLYFQNFNLLYNRPRASLGLSAKLVGTGFMITDSLLDTLGGWNTVTLTEDTELAAQCAMAGVRIHYVPEAKTYDEQPLTLGASMRQRRRWSSGVMSVANRYIIPLLWGKPTWLRLDYGIFLTMIYVQLFAAIPMLYSLTAMTLPGVVNTLLISAAGFWIGMSATAVFLCLTNGRSLRKMWKSVLLYPLFAASWYPLHILSLVSKPKTWKPIAHVGQKQEQMRKAS